MKPEQLNEILQRNPSLAARNQHLEAGATGTAPIVESGAGDATLGKAQAKAKDTGRFLVRITSRRKRLIDQDNLCEKFHVDCLRYAGIIPGDAPSQTRIEVGQVKTAKGEPEEIHIEVSQL